MKHGYTTNDYSLNGMIIVLLIFPIIGIWKIVKINFFSV